MDLNKLKTFYVLAQVKNYSKCAEKLFVTQSAVSHAIKSLEQSLDLVLIQKKRPGFELTGEGEILYKSCGKIFAEVDAVSTTLLKTKDYLEQIRLGSPVEFGNSIVVKGLYDFYKANPNINVDLTLSDSLLQPLLDDELDIIIDCRPHLLPDLAVIPLFREEYVVIVSPAYMETLRIRDISDLERCTLLSMDRGLVWWTNFIHALDFSRQLSFQRVTVINHIRGIINATMCSMGVGFVPRYSVLKELAKGSVVELFTDLELLNDIISIYVKKGNVSQKKINLLIEHITGIAGPDWISHKGTKKIHA